MYWLVQTLIPLGVAVVLPIMVVWLIMRTETNRDNKRAEVLMDVLKDRPDVDVDALVKAMSKSQKTPEEKQLRRLLLGIGFSIAGIGAALLAYIVYDAGYALDSPLMFLACAVVGLAVGVGNLAVFFAARKK